MRQHYTVAKTRRLLMRYEDRVLLRLNNDMWRDAAIVICRVRWWLCDARRSVDRRTTRDYTRTVMGLLSRPGLCSSARTAARFMYQRNP